MPSTIQMMSQNKNLLPDVPSGSSLLFLNEDDGRFWLKTPDGNFIPSSNNLPELEEGKYLKVEGGVLVWADGGSGILDILYDDLISLSELAKMVRFRKICKLELDK
ncbi:MAG: hypothetical protein HPY57_13980 [Ignavibacteria bacterium]|nr:hypothetical protein [Ignavibacteria bacterium]